MRFHTSSCSYPLASRTPNEALDDYVVRVQVALSCIVNVISFGSGSTPGKLHTLTLYALGQSRPNSIRLRTHGWNGELILRIVQRYDLQFQPDFLLSLHFEVSTAFYHYQILDRDGGEIVVFHWEPDGRSPVGTPHLHVPAAGPVILPQPDGSRVAGAKTHLSKLHLPTGRIGIEEIVELLVADFNVDPLLPNWREVLTGARSADRH